MSDTRVYPTATPRPHGTPFTPGDRVRTNRDAYRGDLPEGTHGTFTGYTVVRTMLRTDSGNDMQTMGVVDFPGRPNALISLRWLTLVRPADSVAQYIPAGATMHYVPSTSDARDDVKAQNLAHAHEKVAEAYKALAYALNDLKAVESR